MADQEEKEEDKVSLRDKTLKIDSIDEQALSRQVLDQIADHANDHERYHQDRIDWLESSRDLQYQNKQGPFDNSSKLHVPLTLTLGKATHARLWQMFNAQVDLIAVEANSPALLDKEETVRSFMNWNLARWVNRGRGVREVVDAWLWDIVFDGSGVLKLGWDRWIQEYEDVEEQAEIEEDVRFEQESFVEDISQTIKFKEVNVERREVRQAPSVGRVLLEDFFMPPGYTDVDEAPWVAQRVYMNDDTLKQRAEEGKFDAEIVEEIISNRTNKYQSETTKSFIQGVKDTKSQLEGTELSGSDQDKVRTGNENHLVIEYYGRAFVETKIDGQEDDDMKKQTREIVTWVHESSRKVLGWTYLHRISPNGSRPFFKADFIPSLYRSYGIGVSEMLYSINNHVDAVHNLRLDNGILASLQFGFYRASSTIKPDVLRLQPGELAPLEDVNDVKFANFPMLGQSFASSEEQQLNGLAERLLSINAINLSQTEGVSGALRNATGANLLSRESQVQLSIHFERISRSFNKLLRNAFVLSRERMPSELVFRVTGDLGQPVFGKVSREELKGDFDFDISMDLLGASEQEKQQRAVLMMQTLMNPAFMQTGIVQPENLYNIAKGFVKAHGIKRVDDLVTKPEGYQGSRMSPMDRIMKIVVGMIDEPPIESTIRLDENHQEAISFMDRFKESDEFGLFTRPDQLTAFERVMQRHNELMQAQQAGVANRAGVQVSPESLGPVQAAAPGQSAQEAAGPLESAEGEARGPVV
jgi:hypothetical protein